MSLQRSIQRAVKALFKSLGDLVGPAVYKSVGATSVWDADSGQTVHPITDYPLKTVAFVRFTEKDTDKDPALLEDMKMLFPRQDLPVEPKPHDKVYQVRKKKTWEIIKNLGEPAEAVAIFQVRAS